MRYAANLCVMALFGVGIALVTLYTSGLTMTVTSFVLGCGAYVFMRTFVEFEFRSIVADFKRMALPLGVAVAAYTIVLVLLTRGVL